MKNIILILFIVTVGSNFLLSQDGQSSTLLRNNNVKNVETYFFVKKETQDSILITREDYNIEGRRSKIEIYDTLGLTDHYEYDYLFDTIKIERRIYFRNILSSITKLENDEYGNELRATDYGVNGDKLGMASEKIYNDQQQLLETLVYNGDIIFFHEKREYHENGNLMEVRVLKPNKLQRTSVYKENGELKYNQNSKFYWNKEIFENYRNSGVKVEQVDSRRANRIRVIGVSGILDLKPFDNLRTQIFYLNNGLIDYEIQFLNGSLIGKRSYSYIQKH